MVLLYLKLTKEDKMKIDSVSLKHWINTRCGNGSPKDQKEEAAFILGVGVATVYRWLKAGNVYLEDSGPSMSGDDGSILIWEMKKLVEA